MLAFSYKVCSRDSREFCHYFLINNDCSYAHGVFLGDTRLTEKQQQATSLIQQSSLNSLGSALRSSHKASPRIQGQKHRPPRWSLQFSRCFIVPISFFVRSRENGKIIKSLKSQCHRSIRLWPHFFISVGNTPFLYPHVMMGL